MKAPGQCALRVTQRIQGRFGSAAQLATYMRSRRSNFYLRFFAAQSYGRASTATAFLPRITIAANLCIDLARRAANVKMITQMPLLQAAILIGVLNLRETARNPIKLKSLSAGISSLNLRPSRNKPENEMNNCSVALLRKLKLTAHTFKHSRQECSALAFLAQFSSTPP